MHVVMQKNAKKKKKRLFPEVSFIEIFNNNINVDLKHFTQSSNLTFLSIFKTLANCGIIF